MTDLRTAAQQALEALEGWKDDAPSWWTTGDEKTITALRAALEQPEQAPAAWIQPDHLQKAKQAPFLCRVEPTQRCADFVPFFTHPPRREWRGLTEEEFWPMLEAEGRADRKPVEIIAALARAIEATLKERNHE